MLEYAYIILDKFKFDEQLFGKELKKCISYLNDEETLQLQKWVQVNYTRQYPKLHSFFIK